MAELGGSIYYEEYTGEEEAWTPPEYAELIKLKKLKETVEPVRPEYREYETLKKPKKTLVIDIETTGTDITTSRLVAIGFLDADSEELKPNIIWAKRPQDEEEAINKFIDMFEGNGYEVFVGYNADFDYRFLIMLCMKYRIRAPNFFAAQVDDVMNMLTTGKMTYVHSRNKDNKLDEWGNLLLGVPKEGSMDEYFAALKDSNWDWIEKYNNRDVLLTWMLYNLYFACAGMKEIKS